MGIATTKRSGMWHDGRVTRSTIVRLRVLSSLAMTLVSVTSCTQSQSGSVQDAVDVTISNIASPTDPIATSPPTSSADKDVPEAGDPQSEVINIFIETSEGMVQEASVPLGSPVNIRVRSSIEDEFHLHGYDIELRGTDVLISFTADRLGRFVLEGHDSGDELLILMVFED